MKLQRILRIVARLLAVASALRRKKRTAKAEDKD
jgi:hypothetical protein